MGNARPARLAVQPARDLHFVYPPSHAGAGRCEPVASRDFYITTDSPTLSRPQGTSDPGKYCQRSGAVVSTLGSQPKGPWVEATLRYFPLTYSPLSADGGFERGLLHLPVCSPSQAGASGCKGVAEGAGAGRDLCIATNFSAAPAPGLVWPWEQSAAEWRSG